MIIKSGTKITYDENNFYFDVVGKKVGKITSRVLPNLLGYNNFISIGEAFLDRFGLLVFQDIEKWYAVRGEMGEILALEYLKKYFEVNNILDLIQGSFKTYKLQDFKGYDMFNIEYAWGNEFFGGVPDITIKTIDKSYLVEVKSKNMKNYDYIVGQKQIPKQELLQAQHLGTLMTYSDIIMVYVFFTDEQEELIKTLVEQGLNALEILKQLNLSISNVKVKIAIRDVEHEQTSNLQERAKNELHKCFDGGFIPRRYFNEDEILMLEQYADENKKDDFINDIGQFIPF